MTRLTTVEDTLELDTEAPFDRLSQMEHRAETAPPSGGRRAAEHRSGAR